MNKKEYKSKLFRITYTLEEEGPHPTIPHDYYEDTCLITAVLQGGGICSVEGTPCALEPGAIMVLSPEEIRCFRLRQEGCHERMSLYFTGSILSVLGDAQPVWKLFAPHCRKLYVPGNYDPATVQPILEKMRSLICGEESMKEARLHLLIMELLFALYDAGHTDGAEMSVVQDGKVAQICRYIKMNLAEDLRYETLQQRFLVSRYLLTEVFHRVTGMPLTEYILLKRLTEAASRIREGTPMELAAQEVGFHTYSHFYKAFKKRYGVSPRQYAKNTPR